MDKTNFVQKNCMQNYKVFINNGLIIFGEKDEFPPLDLCWSDFQFISSNKISGLVDSINKNQFKGYWLVQDSKPLDSLRLFSKEFISMQAAGGLVLNNKGDLLMIHRFGKWDFPKGHVEKDEINSQAAIREVMEETAVKSITILKMLPSTYHMYPSDNSWILKITHWYLMRSNYEGPLKPQMDEQILAAIWVPIYTLPEYMSKTYPAISDLVDYIDRHQWFDAY